MKAKKVQERVQSAPAGDQRLGWYSGAAAALIAFFWAYSPALRAPFVFDDTKQIFAMGRQSGSLWDWMRTPIRPLLMGTYWFNHWLSQDDTYTYHVVNLLIHATTTFFVWLILRRLAEWSGMEKRLRELLSAFGAALFLLHPAQTESVVYIAGRSESLSGMFAAASLAAFLYRKHTAISLLRAAAVVALAIAAILCKEHGVVLFAVFLLTDYWWNPGFSMKGIAGNWRLYLPLLAGFPPRAYCSRN